MELHKGAVAYAATSFASTLMNTVFNFYYVKIYLNRFHVEESWFHTAQIIFMIWNAINDPLFGYIQDNFSFSWVKSRRHSILYGAPWFAASFLLTWFPWDPTGTNTWLSGLQLLVVLCFYDSLFTFVLLAQCALFTEMSPRHEDRLRLVQYSQVASLMGSGAVLFCETISHNLEQFHLFQFACVLIAFVSFGSMYYTGRNADTEYDLGVAEGKITKAAAQEHGQAQGMWKQIWVILRGRNFLAFVFMNFFQVYANTFSDNFSSIFCDRLISEDVFTHGMRSAFYGSLFIVPPVIVIVGARVIRQFGYYRIIRTSFILTILMSLILYLSGPDPLMIILYFWFLRVIQGGVFKLFNLSLSDIIDDDRVAYKRSYPQSSMVYGTNALITKPAISIAPMITVYILNRHGYSMLQNPGDIKASAPNPELDSVMFSLMVWTPIGLSALQLFIWSFYTIRNSHVNDETHEMVL